MKNGGPGELGRSGVNVGVVELDVKSSCRNLGIGEGGYENSGSGGESWRNAQPQVNEDRTSRLSFSAAGRDISSRTKEEPFLHNNSISTDPMLHNTEPYNPSGAKVAGVSTTSAMAASHPFNVQIEHSTTASTTRLPTKSHIARIRVMGICHHGTPIGKSPAPMIFGSKRAGVAGNVPRSYKSTRRFLYNRITRSVMSSSSNSHLWNPSSGIRFSPKTDYQPRYPLLEVSRFVHTPSLGSDAAQMLPIEPEEFSDDEEFERNAAEWFDQQDLLMLPPPEPAAEELQHATNAGADPSDGPNPENEPVERIPPPVTSLDYNVDPELYEAAQNSKTGSEESFWSYRMYRHLLEDGSQQKVKIHYCVSKHTMEHVCKKYFAHEKVIGFDLEWMIWAKREDGPRKNVSLIQIASPGRIALFHVALFLKNDFVAPTFKKIMEDESVSKVGVAIKADCTRLKTQLDIDTKGIFELSHLYRLVKYSKAGQLDLINKTSVALAIQTHEFLGLPLFKGQSVRSSNWMLPLSERQIAYSASDAYAGLQLYHVLEQERKKLDPSPPRPEFAERGLPIRFLTAEDVDESDEVLDSDTEAGIEIEPELENSAIELPQSPVVIPEEQSQNVRDSRLTAADLSVQQYRTQIQRRLKVAPSALRTYYIWYANEDLPPESVAKLLRNPPLKTNTVVSYILDAIACENLPFSKSRLKSEVLSLIAPDAFLRPKYQALVQEAQQAEGQP
ncbi:hypothetical protein NM208_g8228 [Fusarium decemcellulare]|uniref:Uncharacterized protein n=1 Tax=Fusarium decemcellulare TaxID=57161 RepID=A0ACC1S660_9HYPO|nr:hypothetical protein NM208_g8228 [Fusarium decemcellulare]